MEIIDMDFNVYTFASTDIDMMLGVATCVLAFLVVKVSNCIIYSGSGSDSGSDSDSDSGSNSDSDSDSGSDSDSDSEKDWRMIH